MAGQSVYRAKEPAYIDFGYQTNFIRQGVGGTIMFPVTYNKTTKRRKYGELDSTYSYIRHKHLFDVGVGAEYYFDNNLLIEARITYVFPRYRTYRYSLGHSNNVFGTYYSLHYKFSPSFKSNFIVPEIGYNLFLWRHFNLVPSISYYIPINEREKWYAYFYPAIKLKITFWARYSRNNPYMGEKIIY